MKVLVTGFTASQCSENANNRLSTFTGLFKDALDEIKCDVTWKKPQLTMSKEYLDQYDLIVVGIASPQSLAANYVYAGLWVASQAKDLGKLRLIVDAPDPYWIWSGIRDCNDNPQKLFKPFYASRRNYLEAQDPRYSEPIYSFLKHLYTERWVKTIVPSIPWFSKEVVSNAIKNIQTEDIIGICYDREIIDASLDRIEPSYGKYWCADAPNSNWTKKVIKNLIYEVLPVRSNKYSDSVEVLNRIENSIGTLISTYKNNDPWWSIAISQSIAAGVPVVTDWRHTSWVGAEWASLPSTVEEMSPNQRLIVAQSQKNFYRDATPSREESLQKTAEALDNQILLLLV
jgi:hypothetical protein